MKRLILMLFLLPLFAIGQNRFEKEFVKADSVFTALFEGSTVKGNTVSLASTDNSGELIKWWNQYIDDCKKPYYQDTAVVVDQRYELRKKEAWDFPFMMKDYLIPAKYSNMIILYIKKWRTPCWEDFWNRYLKENKIIKFE